ncbi:MAG TPA: 2OG-Fe(II) oxygenase [Gammaproteobacteria bacterium]|nr:2OG-Fe(II) oxygenase [Gammaproteobacteria bacterium]
MSSEQALPPFQIVATAKGLFRDTEMDRLIARYDSSDQGFYDWHTDFGDIAPRRTISITVQLSRPEDYDGGELELFFRSPPASMDRTRGAFIAFPSFAVHRVAPVTRGTRWSLVAWICGDRWR